MRIKNLFRKIQNLPKKYVVAIAVGVVLTVPVIAIAGYGPNRPVFDWNNPADRKGSLNGPVFNSFIHTPTYGDERAFVDAKDAANTKPGGFSDTVSAVGGKVYTIRAYIHNNANQSTNASGLGVAKNTKVRFKILSGMANGNEVTGYISADNAAPKMVYDTVKLKNNSKAFSLEYVPGSARIENNAHPYPGVALSDNIVGNNGVAIGYSQMNGNLPGCFQYTAIVTIKVKVKTPKLQIDKGVSNATAPKKDDLVETLKAKPGDTVTWRIDYKNTGTEVAEDITVRDPIPAGLKLVPGSITWIDVNHQSGKTLPDTALTSGGVNVGNYAPNGNGLIRYRTTVDSDVIERDICLMTNVAYGRAHDIPELNDNARVVIENCEATKPLYSCDLLSVEKIGDRKYRYTASATAVNGAKVSMYMFDFGDGTEVLKTDKKTVEHKYAKNGEYIATVKVQVDVDGTKKVAESSKCMKPIAIKVTTTTTGELPDTGAGSVAGIFTGTSLVGAFLHRKWTTRRR